MGIQTTVPATLAGTYTGTENASSQGVDAATGSESFQAAWYTKLVDFTLCDADIAKVNIFKLVDESDLGGWQSGLFYQGYVPKPAAAAFKAEVAKTAGKCPTGAATYFTPSAGKTPAAKPKVKPRAKSKLKPVVKLRGKTRAKPHAKGVAKPHRKPHGKRK